MRAAMIDTRPTLVCMVSTSSALRTTRGDYRQPERRYPLATSSLTAAERQLSEEPHSGIARANTTSPPTSSTITATARSPTTARGYAPQRPRQPRPQPARRSRPQPSDQAESRLAPRQPHRASNTTPTDGGHNPRTPRPVPRRDRETTGENPRRLPVWASVAAPAQSASMRARARLRVSNASHGGALVVVTSAHVSHRGGPVRPVLGSANSRSGSCKQVSSHGGVDTTTAA